MEKLTVHGLTVRETEVGEYDKIITLVTMEQGRMSIMGKGVKSLKSKNMAACQPFCYSTFTLRRSDKYYYIVESELSQCFYGLRTDLDKMALAAYLCDVCADCSVEGSADPALLRLTLNALYPLSEKEVDLQQLKAAFEFKCACEMGFQPQLDGCAMCGCSAGEDIYLDIMNGRILCRACRDKARMEGESAAPDSDGTARYYLYLTPGVLSAMQYIENAPVNRFLSFVLDKDDLRLFCGACEKYLLHHLEHSFSTLGFYKSLLL